MAAPNRQRVPNFRRLRQLLRPFLGGLVFSLSDESILLAASIAARCQGDAVLFYRELLRVLLGRDFAPTVRDLADLASLWQDDPDAAFVDFPFELSTSAANSLRTAGFRVTVQSNRHYRITRGQWDGEAVARAVSAVFTPDQCTRMETRLRRLAARVWGRS